MDLLEALQPMCFLCKWLGIMPIKYDKLQYAQKENWITSSQKSAQIQISTFAHRVSIVVLITFLTLLFISLPYWLNVFLFQDEFKGNRTLDLTNVFVCILTFITGVSTFHFVLNRIPKLVFILQTLNKISNKLSTTMFYVVVRKYLIAYLTLIFTFMAIYVCFEPFLWPAAHSSYKTLSGLLIIRFINTFLEQQFFILCVIVKCLFFMSNSKLEELGTKFLHHRNVAYLRSLHYCLCDVVRVMDETYDFPLLMWIFMQFFDVLNGLYYFLTSIMQEEVMGFTTLNALIGSLSCTLFAALRGIQLCYAAGELCKEVN